MKIVFTFKFSALLVSALLLLTRICSADTNNSTAFIGRNHLRQSLDEDAPNYKIEKILHHETSQEDDENLLIAKRILTIESPKRLLQDRDSIIRVTFRAFYCRIPFSKCAIFQEKESEPIMTPTDLESQELKQNTTSISITNDVMESLSEALQFAPTGSPTYDYSNMTMKDLPIFDSISCEPSTLKSKGPSLEPSHKPTSLPTQKLSVMPSSTPTSTPSFKPSIHHSYQPSSYSSINPSSMPSIHASAVPSITSTTAPSASPSSIPSTMPSVTPTDMPTVHHSAIPSIHPSSFPTHYPSNEPSAKPSLSPTSTPTTKPSLSPSTSPSITPTIYSSISPTLVPSSKPTLNPTTMPSILPSKLPSARPSAQPSRMPVADMETCRFSVPIEDSDCKSHLTSTHIDEDMRTINRDEYICSPNSKYRFGLTMDESLCLCDGDRKVWCADDCCDKGEDPYVVLESDGNLVAYRERRNLFPGFMRQETLWESGTALGTTKLKIFNNGEVSLGMPEDSSVVYWRAEKENWNYMGSSTFGN